MSSYTWTDDAAVPSLSRLNNPPNPSLMTHNPPQLPPKLAD